MRRGLASPRRQSEHGARRSVQAGLIVAMAIGFLVASGSTLFVTPQGSSATSGSIALGHRSVLTTGHVVSEARSQAIRTAGAAAPWVSCLGCLAVLGASAAVRDRRHRSKISGRGAWTVRASMTPPAAAVVSLSTADTLLATASRSVLAKDSALPAAAVPQSYSSSGAPKKEAPQVYSLSGEPKQEVPLQGLQWPSECRTPAISPTRNASAASFVGGARRIRSPGQAKRSRARSSRAARRSVGAKLVHATSAEVAPPSFDPSRLRQKIQLGVRAPSCLCSKRRWRESKSQCTGKGSDSSTGVRIQANLFGQRHLQTQRTTVILAWVATTGSQSQGECGCTRA
mmetsp:Transcript_10058/g.30073  ORF Transcript_10058/g.30073 Transcript_10058/m.30073 type:complete len:342 (-) Transcript_10058:242-1267(-)